MSEPLTFAAFLETRPPGTHYKVTGMSTSLTSSLVATPDLRLHCDSEACNDTRFFWGKARHHSQWESGKSEHITLIYLCRNCREYLKIYTLMGVFNFNEEVGSVIKIGEYPVFGAPIPAKLVKLVGPDRDALLKANRSEQQGLGVGAFAYYRRIVENQRGRIFDAIVAVIEKQGGDQELLDQLKKAKAETQFTKSVEAIKHALPSSLRIDGHNPLTLLHDALSDGIHAQDDAECLELAGVVRTVLSSLAQRLSELSAEHKELGQAVSTLLNRKKPSGDPSKKPPS